MSTEDDSALKDRDKTADASATQTADDGHPGAGLSAFQQEILRQLFDEPDYGLGLKRDLETYYGEEVNHGRLYPNLDELTERGLLEKTQQDKRTNEYALTDEGRYVVRSLVQHGLSSLGKDELGDDLPQEGA